MSSRIKTPLTKQSGSSSKWLWLLSTICLLVILTGMLRSRRIEDSPSASDSARKLTGSSETEAGSPSGPLDHARRFLHRSSPASELTAEEIVASKVSQFGRSRREMARAMGRRAKKEVPPEVERFFDAIESGVWEEIEKHWNALSKQSGQYEGSSHSPELDPFWNAVLDAYGVAEQAHLWPPQKLLDYGNSILDSLRPGMVYVGGTDPGRWIPELLNETSGGEQHIIVTQNAFADGRYVDFMNTLYGDRLSTLTSEDSKRAFDEYVTDAQKRLEHDQQFPDEPKQIRPGEDVRFVDGKVQVSGQIAVMTINEKLFQTLLAKNPEVSFAIEQSYPFKSTYDSATPVGPIMEVRVQDEQYALTRERASQSVDYWRATTEQLLSDSRAADSSDVRMAYSKLASEQGALLLERNYTAEAEQTFRLATEIAPSSPEAVFRFVNLLVGQSRFEEAIPVIESALKVKPDNQQFRDLLEQVQNKSKR